MWMRSSAYTLIALGLAACAGPRPSELPPAPASSFTVPIASGTSLKAVAERFQVKEDDLLALNKISDRNSLSGRIRIPAYGWDREPIVSDPPKTAPRLATVAAAPKAPPRPAPNTRVDAAPLAAPPAGATAQTRVATAQPRAPEAAQQATPTAPPAQSGMQSGWFGDWFGPMAAQGPVPPAEKLIWPVQGRVISPFGQSAGGGRNDGINISARYGSPLHAADAGTVSYVGNELKGYGNLVLIQHDNGYVTAYAHAERIDVQKGERVSRGQVIGAAGQTGDVREPQVHFELRLGTRPIDPTPYFVDRMAAN